MFGPRIQQYARHIAESVVRPFAALGLTPNMATLLGLLLNGFTAAVIATGHLRIGGALLLFAGLFDMVDGALARVRNQKTTFGAFFDSTLDRISEGLVLLGIIVFALTHASVASERTWLVALTYVAGLGSLMVSYARARAEGLGLNGKSGLMARPERVLLLAAGLIIGGAGWLLWTIAILAVTSTFTTIQRIVSVWRTLSRTAATAATTATQTSNAVVSKAETHQEREQMTSAADAEARDQRVSTAPHIATRMHLRRPRPTSRNVSSERTVKR